MTGAAGRRGTVAALALVSVAAMALTGCGDQTGSGSSTQGGDSAAPLFSMLPADIQKAGVIRVGTDATYAPMEFKEGDKIVGVDPDIAAALSTKLGVKFEFTSGTFDTLLTALPTGRTDIAMSSITDTKARQEGLDDKGQKTGNGVDFVDYFNAGSIVYVRKGNPKKVNSIEDLCGKTTAVQRGTTFETVAKTQSEACEKAGKPAVKIESFPTDAEAQTRVKAGGADAGINDYPVAAHLARTAEGGNAFEIVGEQVDAGPFGIAVDKKDTQLRDALKEALDAIILDGSYKKALDKWGAGTGAVTSAEINGGS